MGRATLGAFRSTPLGIVVAESALIPARTLLDHRKARFAQRLLARPEGGSGPEEILEREADLARDLRAAAGVQIGETGEMQTWGERGTFQGRVFVGKEEEALEVVMGWRDRTHTV